MTTHVTKKAVRLEGYQSPFKPSKFGKCGIMAIIDSDMVDVLEEERPGLLEWGKSKMKNAKRATEKFEPWEEVSDGQYQVKFSWPPETPVAIVDSEGTPITNEIPLYNGSLVKLAFRQKPYATADAYGTTLKLQAIQVIQASGSAGVDSGDLDATAAAALFGKTQGFKVDDPNVTPTESTGEEIDF